MTKAIWRFVVFIIFLVLFQLVTNRLQSQEVAFDMQFRHITEENGLANNIVSDIVQDSSGFLWFGTLDGLCRYDGYTMKIYRQSDDPNSLCDNYILDVFLDKQNILWIGTYSGGLSRFDPSTETFTTYTMSGDHPLASNRVTRIVQDRSGLLWLSTFFGGLTRLDPLTGQTLIFEASATEGNSISSNLTTEVLVDVDGSIWVGTQDQGLNHFDPKTSTFTCYKNIVGETSSLKSNEIYSLYLNKQGQLMVGTHSGLSVFNRSSETFQNQFEYGINDIKEFDGYYIYATLFGLVKQKKLQSESKVYIHSENIPATLSHNDIISIFSDKSGILYLGTGGGGVNVYYQSTKKFLTYSHNSNLPNTLSSNIVRGFTEDAEGNIWVVTMSGGINIFEPKPGYFHSLAMGNFKGIHLNVFSTLCAYADLRKNIWVGTWGEGVYMLPKGKKEFVNLRKEKNRTNTLLSDIVHAFYDDGFGNIWIGTEDGLSIYNPSSQSYRNFTQFSADNQSITQYSVQSNCILSDAFGNFWVGTYGGLNHFIRERKTDNPFTDNFRVVKYAKEGEEGVRLNDERIISIHHNPEIDKQSIFVGTYGGGLQVIKLNATGDSVESIRQYTDKDGLPNNVIFTLLSDESGNLWMSTNKGLARFNPNTLEVNTYDRHDGLQGDQFYWGAGYKNSLDEFYFGGITGFSRFQPQHILLDQYLPAVVITEMRIANKPVLIGEEINGKIILTKDINKMDKVVLSYHENIFSFEFAALHYAFPQDNAYEYMLEGFEKEFNRIESAHRLATYTNLNPGDYVFRVRASNHDGVWNPTEKTLRIVITPPFWKTLWFRLMVLLTIAGLIFLIYLRRVAQIKSQSVQLSLLVEKKTQELADKNSELEVQAKVLENANSELTKSNATKDKFFSIIAHDLKNPINVLLGFADLLQANYDQYDDVKRKRFISLIVDSTEKLNNLTDNLLTWSRSQAGHIRYHFQPINITALIEENIHLFQEVVKKKKIHIEFLQKNNAFHALVDTQSMATVLRNLLANAIKFTPADGRVEIDIIPNTGQKELLIKVSDTGVGISDDQREKLFSVGHSSTTQGTQGEKGTGLGLILCQEFVEANKGKIWIESLPEKGTTVSFTCPLAE